MNFDDMNFDDFVEAIRQNMEEMDLRFENFFLDEHTKVEGDEYDGDDEVIFTLHDPDYNFTIVHSYGYKNKGTDEHGEPIIDCIYENVEVHCDDEGEDFRKWLEANGLY